MPLIEVNCYSCGSGDYTHYYTENGYDLVKCSNCGLLYVNPRPSEEDISEALTFGVHKGEERTQFTDKYKPHFIEKYLRILEDFYPKFESDFEGKCWLDIGCGFGELLEALNLHSDGKLKTIGSEPNEIKQQYARENNLDVSYISLENHEGKYDFISFLNVYSHLPDPVAFISNLKKILKPGGEIFMQTGHTSHLSSRQHIKPFSLPDHLSFANRDIVENIFRISGFEMVEVKIYKPHWHPYTVNYMRLVKDIIKAVLGMRKNPNPILPRHPYQDMFIRCRLKDS